MNEAWDETWLTEASSSSYIVFEAEEARNIYCNKQLFYLSNIFRAINVFLGSPNLKHTPCLHTPSLGMVRHKPDQVKASYIVYNNDFRWNTHIHTIWAFVMLYSFSFYPECKSIRYTSLCCNVCVNVCV